MNTDNKGYAFMAFSKGVESTEGTPVKRYVGVAPVYVLAVNPNKEQLEKLYNTQLEKAPEYIGELEEVDGTKTPNVRLDFIVKTDAERCNDVDLTTKLTFFIRKSYRYNKDMTKVQVIDKYGRTAWVTIEQAKTHEIPTYSNGQLANIDKDYRPAFVGEEDLTNFLKTYLNIPSVMKYVNEKWVMTDKPADCEARLENIEKYFKGDFTELRNAIALQPNNKIKVMFGVRNTDDNKQYQTIYNQMFLRNSVTDYSKLDKHLQERKNAGAYSTTEFSVDTIREYTVAATDFKTVNSSAGSESPFDSEGTNDPFGFTF